MKISPMKQKMIQLRESINLPTIDQIERMLNASKGTGTTNTLIEIAKLKRLPILVESETVAESLKSLHPEVTFHPFSKQLPGQQVLIDVSTMWVLLREARKIQKQSESLLNWMEHKSQEW